MKKLLVIGGGKSGLSALELGYYKDYECFLYDDFPEKIDKSSKLFLSAYGVELLDRENLRKIDFDTVVVSPGVPQTNPVVNYFLEKKSDVISEIEFGYRFLQGRLIGITGSNGKTTTTALTGSILEPHFKTAICGNYGYPFCKALLEQKFEGIYVVELSSFQLELVRDFRPDIAGILNLSPDHLDRYPSADEYYRAKFNIFKNMTEKQRLFVNGDDAETNKKRDLIPRFAVRIGKNTLPVSVDKRGVYYDNNLVVKAEKMKLKGLHNIYNAAFALSMAMSAGAGLRHSVEVIEKFSPIEHRLEFVDIVRGVYFFNDSKATNFDSAVKALSSFKNIHWIAGGIYKGGDFEDFYPFARNIKKAYFIGDAAPIFHNRLKSVLNCEISLNLENAVKHAFETAVAGDVILLAPGCSSFDHYANYEERGKAFKRLVRELKK